MGQVTRRDMMRWLETHGFVQEPGKATGHLHFAGPGVEDHTARTRASGSHQRSTSP
jgi:hypothetical protein